MENISRRSSRSSPAQPTPSLTTLGGGRARPIPLTQGQIAWISAEDYPNVSQWKWYARWVPNIKGFYAARGVWTPGRKRRTVFLHREIMGLEYGDPRQVDHVNHDTLDNRRENIRVVSHRENGENRRDQSAHGTGVYWNSRLSKFMVQVGWEGRSVNLGLYKTAAEARFARDLGLKILKRGWFDPHAREGRAMIRNIIRMELQRRNARAARHT